MKLILPIIFAFGLSLATGQEGTGKLAEPPKTRTPEERQLIREALARGDEQSRKEDLAFLREQLRPLTTNSQRVISIMHALGEVKLAEDEIREIYPDLVKSQSTWIRQIALEHLGRLQPDHPAMNTLLPLVTASLEDEKNPDFVRGAAARTLGILSPSEETAGKLAALLDLRSSSAAVRQGALKGLSAIGKRAVSASELVAAQMDDGTTGLRYSALRTLVEIGGTERNLSSKRGRAVVEAMVGIRALNAKAASEPKRSELLMARQLSRQNDPLIKLLVLDELTAGEIGEPGSYAAVLNTLTSQDSYLDSKARYALLSSKKLNPGHLPVLIEALKAPGFSRKEVAAQLLSRLGPSARPAAPTVLAELRTVNARTSLEYRGYLLDVLRKIGKASDEGITARTLLALLPETSAFLSGLSRPNANYTRGYLILTLSEIGMPEEGYPFVLDGLANSDLSMGHVFGAAAIAAPSFVGKANELGPVLARAFEPDFSDAPLYFESFGQMFGLPERATSARLEGIRALGAMGASVRDQLPGLRKMEAEVEKVNAPELLKVIRESIQKIETP